MKLDPFMKHDHSSALQKRDLIQAGIYNIEKFLVKLGIRVTKIEPEIYELATARYQREYAYSFRFHCSCPQDEFKFFDSFSRVINVTRYPKVKDLTAIFESGSIMQTESMYDYDEIVDFEFQAEVQTLEDVDEFARRIMTATKELQYKRFCEDFDDQVEDELGE